jgi:hypothetical protein
VRAYELLAAAYKQLDAAVGQFGHDSEIVSTIAAESSSPGDAVYRGFDRQLAACQAARDGLAGRIRTAINDAAFDGHPISGFEAGGLSFRAAVLIAEMHELSRLGAPPRSDVCRA